MYLTGVRENRDLKAAMVSRSLIPNRQARSATPIGFVRVASMNASSSDMEIALVFKEGAFG